MIDFNSRGYIMPPEAITVDFDIKLPKGLIQINFNNEQ